MKKTSAKSLSRGRRPARRNADEIPAEIDFSGAVRNPYAARYATGSNIVMLEPDVAALFPNSASVNEALRSLARVVEARKGKRPSHQRTA
jgi:hypothetical protein